MSVALQSLLLWWWGEGLSAGTSSWARLRTEFGAWRLSSGLWFLWCSSVSESIFQTMSFKELKKTLEVPLGCNICLLKSVPALKLVFRRQLFLTVLKWGGTLDFVVLCIIVWCVRPRASELCDRGLPWGRLYFSVFSAELFVRHLCLQLAQGRLLHLCNDWRFVFRYLAKNSASLFSASDYEVAPPEYHRKAVWGGAPAPLRLDLCKHIFV